jgi:hypothetical protein
MGAPFRDARLKIDRAKEHVRDLESAISALEEDAISTTQGDTDTGTELVKHEHPKLAEGLLQLSLISGDAIHNLRVALDYAWFSTIERHAPWAVSDHNSFPVRKTRKDVENVLRGIEIDTRCRDIFNVIMSDIQPYDGGQDRLIWALHNIDISDKHILLLELSPITGIRGISISDDAGQVYDGISIHTEPHKPHILRLKPGMKFENQGKFSLNVTIKEADVFKGILILDLLQAFSDSVFRSVKLLENL